MYPGYENKHAMFIEFQMMPYPSSLGQGFRHAYFLHQSALREEHTKFLTMRDRAQDHHHLYSSNRGRVLNEFKARMRANLATLREDRFGRLSARLRKNLKTELIAFAIAKNNEDHRRQVESLNTIFSHHPSLARRIAIEHAESIWQCDDCDEFFNEDDNRTSTNRSDYICDCCSGDYYWSECMNTYIHPDDIYDVYDSVQSYRNECRDDVCTHSFGHGEFYYYDGVYFSDCDDRERVASGDSIDDEDNEFRGLNDYHNARRDFCEENETEAYPALGVELEVFATNDRYDTLCAIRDEYDERFILERDGSLDDEQGFELITQPYGREEWNELTPGLTKLLSDEHVIGYNDPAGSSYGIHVTIHRRHFSPLAEARIMLFLTCAENAWFVRAVAQRKQIYAADSGLGIGSLEKSYQKIQQISNFEGLRSKYHRHGLHPKTGEARYQSKIRGRGKYCPVNWKGDLAEFRIFQSTVNPCSFMKNLEFVWALHAWTKPESCTGSSYHHKDFLLWLNTPEHRKEFPFLSNFLSKQKFYGTNFEPFSSPWKNLMVKPLEIDAIEPISA